MALHDLTFLLAPPLWVLLLFAFSAMAQMHVQAQDLEKSLTVSVEIPRLDVAEYHRPYLALWLEEVDGGSATNLAVWYDTRLKDREGEKWLKDMRQWWRRSGRSVQMPLDGISGATRAPGIHRLSFTADSAPLAALSPGRYRLMIEAAREVGGRELLQLEFDWPASHVHELSVLGQRELGQISVTLNP